jgi:hypothetical protein
LARADPFTESFRKTNPTKTSEGQSKGQIRMALLKPTLSKRKRAVMEDEYLMLLTEPNKDQR